MIRVAAVGDIHVAVDSADALRTGLEGIDARADVLLLAGDLTKRGLPEEAEVLAAELDGLPVPCLAVLGNHDYESDQQDLLVDVLTQAGVTVLDGTAATVNVDGTCLGVAGTKGFGGGFPGACATDFGEPEIKAFIRHTKSIAEQLAETVSTLECDHRVVMLHYSPIEQTLQGERLEIYPFLGSYLLAEAVDRHGADLIIHGHAHAGIERGVTPGGIPVRNVSQPVIRNAYHVYCLGSPDIDDRLQTVDAGALSDFG